MDRDHKQELAELLAGLDARRVIVATHDPEFAAAFAQRVVLLADGAPIADGSAGEVLAGGSYFATETARILGGAGGALTPAEGAGAHRAAAAPRGGDRVSWQLGAFGSAGARPGARALPGTSATAPTPGSSPWWARWRRSPRWAGSPSPRVPNVKPTTDIVLIAGYALGGAPGFAVGALAALTSNFFFGQGPWTPWQMAAWGATGVLGAMLAWGMRARTVHPTRGRWGAGRWRSCAARRALPSPCVQDVGDWVTFSDHSLGQLGVYVGQGLGFDAVHAAGCLAFALALGPALTRSIQRFARRIEVTWIPGGAGGGAAAAGRPGRGRARDAGDARARGGDVARRRSPQPRPTICSAPRTPTAASVPPRASRQISSTPDGRRSGWPPRDTTSTPSATPRA